MDIDSRVQEVIDKIEALGYTVVIVGGFVRDTLLLTESRDYDLATNAPLTEIAALFTITKEYCVLVGDIQVHTVSKINYEGISVEISRFREEIYDENYRLKSIHFVNDYEQDALRRDFTINAIAFHEGHVLDPVGGLNDLKENVLRTVNDPNIRFLEDPSRMIRGLRFAAQYNLTLEDNTAQALRDHKNEILCARNVSDDLKGLFQAPYFDPVYEQYEEVFKTISNGRLQNVSIADRTVLSDDLTLLAYFMFSLTLNYDNAIYKLINFSMKDKKFILSIKPLVRELSIPLTQSDITLLFIAYGKTTMLKAFEILEPLEVVHPLNLLNIHRVAVEGYLKIDELKITESDLNDSYTIKQKYRILKDVQKLIIRQHLNNEREELLNFIQNYY